MFQIGEALVGEGNEVAHIDLMIGEKDSPVGKAFANGMSNLSVGHTPLLAVIRPNLPCKPYTLLVPKVTIKDLDQASQIFGPAQAAVAKAVADSVEDGVLPKNKLEELVIVCSVFVHPKAEDARKIFHYNYGATRLALRRAVDGYPSVEKIMYDKDRAKHPIAGFRVPRLWMPPYLQIAIDITDIDKVKKVISEAPDSDRILLEVGTPLIKSEGAKVIRKLREIAKDKFIIADLKTLDVGQIEADIAFNETADAVVASGLASIDTLNKFIYEAKRLGIYAFVDMMDVEEPLTVLKALKDTPNVVILHRSIDTEDRAKAKWGIIKEIKTQFKNKKILCAVAGGIKPDTAAKALKAGADILIVGRHITQSKDIERTCRDFISLLGEDIDQYRVHVE